MTQKRLKELFEYRADGFLVRKIKVGVHALGSVTGSAVNKDGYRVCGVDGRKLYLHRIIYLFHHGSLPKIIDHVNRDRLDCRIENLRASDFAQNAQNRKKAKKLFTGVYVDSRTGKFRARIGKVQIGMFANEIDAAIAYDKAAKIFYGEYACTNF